jgi:putative glutamine amidotransferase
MSVRIGVSGIRRQWGGTERQGVNSAYALSVLETGAIPLILPPAIGAARAMGALEGIDALLLTGGEDLDPAWYGAPASPLLGDVDRERDLFELALFAAARQRGMPILGICRGIQLINVALGGTLWQHLPGERPSAIRHDRGDARDTRTHGVSIEAGTCAATVLGRTAMDVNSFHHQGIRDLAPPLRASAWAEDGLVEAVESASGEPWLLAVQWHPEEMHNDAAAPERGLFRALAEAAAPAY